MRALGAADGKEKFVSDIGALAPGSPAVLGDRIVIGTDEGHVLCMPRDGGKPLWEFDGVADHAMVYGSPATAEGIVVVGAHDRNVYGLDLSSGALKWKFPTRGDVDASPLISAGRVYVASRDKHLYVLDLQSGRELWKFNRGPDFCQPRDRRGSSGDRRYGWNGSVSRTDGKVIPARTIQGLIQWVLV